jgi:hypothetical protein
MGSSNKVLLVGDQSAGRLERLVKAVFEDQFADFVDQGENAGNGGGKSPDEFPESLMMRRDGGGLKIHQLHDVVDLLADRVRVPLGENVLLAQDWHLVLDGELCEVFAVFEKGAADENDFPRLESDLERHGALGVCRGLIVPLAEKFRVFSRAGREQKRGAGRSPLLAKLKSGGQR